MLKLGFLLIGPAAFRSRWYVLTILGVVMCGLAIASASGYLPGVEQAVTMLLGLAFALYGVASFAIVLMNGNFSGNISKLVSTAVATIIGSLIFLFAPVYGVDTLSVLLAILFVLDGLNRIIPAMLSRFPAWRELVAFSVIEFLLAALLISEWPLPHDRNIAICVAGFVALPGWLLIKVGYLLRNHEEEAALLLLPIFGKRGWYEHAPVLLNYDPQAESRDIPLTVYVWTPVVSANVMRRRPVLDRYLATVDPDGNLSVGHVALGLPPDIYISHYPELEIARSAGNFVSAISARADNHVPGFFQPSYAEEVADWVHADAQIKIYNVSARRLKAFWIGYRQDATYNVANRNCSTLVAAALDAAVEGALTTPYPWLRLVRLLFTPDIWQAALVRSRAEAATWTPGLVLDYATPLARILDKQHRHRSRTTSLLNPNQ